ncbi:hypothetical protein Hanom_Chr03g00179951 [Helianthus anomalus]
MERIKGIINGKFGDGLKPVININGNDDGRRSVASLENFGRR